MARVLTAALIVALLAAAGGWLMYSRAQTAQARERKKNGDLQQQMQSLRDRNAQLKNALAKIQREEERLAAANQDLAKALAQARLTGKIPPLPQSALPYPPK